MANSNSISGLPLEVTNNLAGVPLDDIWRSCNEIATLAEAIRTGATGAISNSSGSEYELVLIRQAAGRIGLLAESLAGGDFFGIEHWLDLPGATREGE